MRSKCRDLDHSQMVLVVEVVEMETQVVVWTSKTSVEGEGKAVELESEEDPPNSLGREGDIKIDLGRRSPWWGWRQEGALHSNTFPNNAWESESFLTKILVQFYYSCTVLDKDPFGSKVLVI